MGLFSKILGLSIRCPDCGAAGARDSLAGVRCPNPDCRNYRSEPARGKTKRRNLITGEAVADLNLPPADFSNPVQIQYLNFKNEQKTFSADPASLRIVRNHLRARVAPEGVTITLNLDRIANKDSFLPQIREMESRQPTRKEKYIMRYHARHNSTSPLNEAIRKKYGQ